MKLKKTLIIYIILFHSLVFTVSSYSQDSIGGMWNIISYSGETSIRGIYRELETRRNGIYEFRKSSYFNGGAKLNTKSYFWHKNFFLLEANGEFNPGTRRELYLIMPDRSELRTHSAVDLRGTFFSENPFSIGGYVNLNQSYFNRETLTNIKSKNRIWGSFLRYSNKYLPVTIDFSQRKWQQSELPSGRVFDYDQNLLQAKATKTFFQTDRHEINYTHNDYRRNYWGNVEVHNIIDRIRLYNNVYFDPEKKYNFNSTITNQNQRGDYSLKRFLTNENIIAKLPHNFKALGNYSYGLYTYEQLKERRNRARADLRHRLYSSLTSTMYYEYSNINRFVINETYHRAGVDFNYIKKIPLDGRLNIAYSYYRQHNNTVGNSTTLQIIAEEHTITTGIIELLDKANVDINSVVVRDETGVIIYDENFDYILVETGNFIEIRRVLGGQIPDGGTVKVDYIATQPGNYKYKINYHHLYVGASIYDRMVELYYRRIKQNFVDVFQTEYLYLNYFTQNIVGLRLEYMFAQAGIEMDNYNSNIIPYKMMRYYLLLQKNFNNRVNTSLNCSYRDYEFLNENLEQKFLEISGKVSYRIKDISTLNIESGYRKHTGLGIDLDIITLRTEIITNIRKMYFILGFEMYQRDYLGEQIILNGGYFQITRKF